MSTGRRFRRGLLLALALTGALLMFSTPGLNRTGFFSGWIPAWPGCVVKPRPNDQGVVRAVAPVPDFGVRSLEERAVDYPTIVRARIDRVYGRAIPASGDGAGGFVSFVGFELAVGEYLSGSGPERIVAVYGWNCLDGSRIEALRARDYLLARARRDATRHEGGAIFFLDRDFPERFDAARSPNAFAFGFDPDDPSGTLLDGRGEYDRRWLPAVADDSGQGAPELYALSESRGLRTGRVVVHEAIPLGEIRARIAAVRADFRAGDGSEEYRNCLAYKYRREREDEHERSKGREPNQRARHSAHPTASGRPTGHVIYETWAYGRYPGWKEYRTWLEGDDAALFEIVDGPITPEEIDGDGTLTAHYDGIKYRQSLRALRPLPDGVYKFDVKDRLVYGIGSLCFDVASHEWTVTVQSPATALHEAFFDPATLPGDAVGARGTGGNLSPAAFEGIGGTSARLDRITWESGQVRVGISPPGAITGHGLEFLALDGTVQLSLDPEEAVEQPDGTLAWDLTDAPWLGGEQLMVRVRRPPPSAPAPSSLAAVAAATDKR